MKASELKKKNKKELEKDLEKLKENLSGLRFKLAANKLKNVREVRNIKKDIARILTILKMKS
ncbi:50S ribosomal protein L29 [Patescibacteria group bacterium]|nr:50S ribosomal protein L29 [Patescibacteria group bacterium]